MPVLHIIQHVPFEPAGILPDLAEARGWQITVSRQFAGDRLPEPAMIARLIVMGGPMGVGDTDIHSFLTAEKDHIKECIARNVPVLGICLGAQLLSEALGGMVSRNPEKEIGFFPVERTESARQSRFFADFPDRFVPLHWHGDTFSLPAGSIQLARSEGCEQQAFEHGPHVGLQFHLEMTEELLGGLIEAGRQELQDRSRFVMSEETLHQNAFSLKEVHPLMIRLFEHWLGDA